MECYQGNKTEVVVFWLSCRVINTSIKCLFLTTFLLVTRADGPWNRYHTGAIIRNVRVIFELLQCCLAADYRPLGLRLRGRMKGVLGLLVFQCDCLLYAY